MKFLNKIRTYLINLLGGKDMAQVTDLVTKAGMEQHDIGLMMGKHEGRREARLHFAVLPLPFTPEQLLGREYGDFITPHKFGVDTYGECNIPAPSQHGYEQRAYYVSKESLDGDYRNRDLHCHAGHKFVEPSTAPQLVPVIVTVLR